MKVSSKLLNEDDSRRIRGLMVVVELRHAHPNLHR